MSNSTISTRKKNKLFKEHAVYCNEHVSGVYSTHLHKINTFLSQYESLVESGKISKEEVNEYYKNKFHFEQLCLSIQLCLRIRRHNILSTHWRKSYEPTAFENDALIIFKRAKKLYYKNSTNAIQKKAIHDAMNAMNNFVEEPQGEDCAENFYKAIKAADKLINLKGFHTEPLGTGILLLLIGVAVASIAVIAVIAMTTNPEISLFILPVLFGALMGITLLLAGSVTTSPRSIAFKMIETRSLFRPEKKPNIVSRACDKMKISKAFR